MLEGICIRAFSGVDSDAAQRELFADLILQGDEVGKATVRSGLTRAPRISCAFEGSALIGIASIKSPDPVYQERVFKMAGIPEARANFLLELGYVFILPPFRRGGLAGRLVQDAMRVVQSGGVFATTRENNLGMQKILLREGFSCLGVPFESSRKKDRLVLFCRPSLD